MTALKTTLTGYAAYRGREGHWSFLLHRVTGLGTGLFLTVHILDIAFVYLAPDLFANAIRLYQSTVFGIGEVALVFCVFFHGVNGLRIAFLDLVKPDWWTISKQRNWTRVTLAISLALWLPSAAVMLYNLLYHNFGLFGG